MNKDNDLVMTCQDDKETRIILQRYFDLDGQLIIGVFPVEEQHCSGASATSLNRIQVVDLINHLQKALNHDNSEEYYEN